MIRRPLKDSELGNLQALGVSQKDLNTLERAFNSRKKVEILQKKDASNKPSSEIYIDGTLVTKVEGY